LFMERNYDVGEHLLINNEVHKVRKISLKFTEMTMLNGERWAIRISSSSV